jgi:hypothetical protein
MVAWDAPAENDGAQVQALTQFLSRIVEAATQPQAAVIGMHEDLDAIENIAFARVGAERVATGDGGIVVHITEPLIVHDDRKRAANDAPVSEHPELAFWKNVDQMRDGLLSPEPSGPFRIGRAHGSGKVAVRRLVERPHLEPLLGHDRHCAQRSGRPTERTCRWRPTTTIWRNQRASPLSDPFGVFPKRAVHHLPSVQDRRTEHPFATPCDPSPDTWSRDRDGLP